MRLLMCALAAAFISAPALADDGEDAAAIVKQFVDGFNSGDVESAFATCAATVHIIDEFPPYAWSGENACEVWANDYVADAESKGITEGFVTLHDPKHAFLDGDRAYIVSPVDYFYMVNGDKEGQKNSVLTSVLEKQDGEWKIIQWSWSTGKLKN